MGGATTPVCVGEVPQLGTIVGAICNQLAVSGALEHQVAGSTQGAAVPWALVFNMPGLLLLHRVPGQQPTLDQCANRITFGLRVGQ